MKSMFQKRQVARVITVILATIGIGILMVCTGNTVCGAIGIGLSIAGLAAFAAGWTYFPPNPATGGVLTSGGKIIIDENGDTVTVKGLVILADYFPFYLGAIRVDMRNDEWVFPMTLLSVEKKRNGDIKVRQVPFKGEVHVTVAPDELDMADFMQSGGSLAEIKKQCDTIVFREAQKIVVEYDNPDGTKGLDGIMIAQQGNLISDALEKKINGTASVRGIFEQKDFGVRCIKVQVDFPLPADIAKAMVNAASIDYENSARMAEYDADGVAAKRIKELLEAGDRSQKPLSPKESLDALVQLRLVRDGNVRRVQMETIGGGKGGNDITVVGTKVDFGDEPKSKNKN